MKPVVERLMGKTIISVQAYEDTPLSARRTCA